MKRSRWPEFVPSSVVICITLCLLLKFVLVQSESCSSEISKLGWTIPSGDIVLRKGSDLEIRCVLNPETGNYSSSQIFFTRSAVPKEVRIPSSNVVIENGTAAVLRLKNVTLMMNQWFYCKLAVDDSTNNSIGSSSSLEDPTPVNERLVCYNSVSVGTEPKDVENFTCVSYNWKTLNCSWSVPDNEVNTYYGISYRIRHRSNRNQIFECPTDDDVHNHTCTWTMDSKPAFRNNFQYLTFTIVGSNVFGNSSQAFSFHTFAHVLPAAPDNLTFTEKTSSSVHLRWSIGDLFTFPPGWKYNITYTCTWNSSSTSVDINGLGSVNDVVSFNVTDLKYASTTYYFSVRMKSKFASNSFPWSDPATLEVSTAACQPYKSPLTDSGSFELIPAVTDMHTRFVYIYWQPVPTAEHNGANFRYEIEVYEDDRKVDNEPLLLKNSYAKFEISLKRHRFVIWSVNNEGRAENGSVVQVPEKRDVMKPPEILSKIDYGGGVFELSWRNPVEKRDAIRNYTVFSCETIKERPYQCDGYLNWEHVPATINKYNFTVNSTSSFQFAVSANAETGSSGMAWAACTVLHDRVNKIKNVWVDKIGSYNISIRWKLECGDRLDGIKGYYIYYCIVEPRDNNKCNGPMMNKTVNGDLDRDHATIEKLAPYTYYKMSISMFTNMTGPHSDWLINRTLDGPPDMTDVALKITSVTNTSITVRWNRPNITNGVLSSYLLFYNNSHVKLPVNYTEATIENLASYETYEIKLKACTSVCSEPTQSLFPKTKIGIPGAVGHPNPKTVNASHVIISWSQPAILAGPKLRYRVRIRLDGADNETKEKVTTNSSTEVDFASCRTGGSYSVDVRAENVDESSNQVFEGEWSHVFSKVCSSGSGLSIFWKFMISVTLFLFLGPIAIFCSKKGMYKCKQMKKVEVVIPAKFNAPSLFPADHKECELYEEFGLPPTKSVEEFCTLVDKTVKPTELSLFSSQT